VAARDDTVRLWFDAKSKELVAIERVEDDPVSATRVTLIAVAGWLPAGAIRVPGSIVVTQNGRVADAQLISQAQANPNSDSAFASVPKKPATGGPSSSVSVVELAPGIYRAEGSPAGVPYNSVFTRTNDSVFVFDPPLNDRYASSIIDSVKGRFPNARARVFVVSHHHSDHVSGARAAFAAGMSAIASSEIADYVRGLGLPAGRKPPGNRRVLPVEDTLAVGSGASRFVLYHVPTGHARGLMMAYFPEAKLVAEVDLAAGPPADRRDLYDFVVKRRITVEKLARMHGPVLPWSTFAQPYQK
jgi:glyoxylase-like metal-dependent hydrolase (beta-lactamase superfamily II)